MGRGSHESLVMVHDDDQVLESVCAARTGRCFGAVTSSTAPNIFEIPLHSPRPQEPSDITTGKASVKNTWATRKKTTLAWKSRSKHRDEGEWRGTHETPILVSDGPRWPGALTVWVQRDPERIDFVVVFQTPDSVHPLPSPPDPNVAPEEHWRLGDGEYPWPTSGTVHIGHSGASSGKMGWKRCLRHGSP
ncbi:hypothetical protein SODALDRAFT_360518 [Sodiomyces alkalinus F11]|uniref:Uncharacterized protein n=1 Tax=Sodiomyces alkalinus (strain CBS 110278 / VKM F-3762 / F11) TaxID=1314773 RepID=A0A3N2PUK8_SODAK|nr:hypothetical protein SODALDRAFT_360518 [Sodiomyces alkalinus F11]ROT38179.1 hypothetical protein SODALDRAFT_360518 [Sodiomyces alkalinus F11]